jgi:ankyrin repeat protein
MDANPLPARPNLEQYRKQAKDLVKARKSGDPQALRRIRQHPRLRKLPEAEFRNAPFALADAQLVIAREHAFESWPKFAKHVEDLARANSPVSQFESAADAVVSGDVQALLRMLGENPGLVRERSTRAHRATLLHYIGANGIEDYRQKSPRNAVEVANLLLQAGADVDARADAYGASTTLGLVATSIHPAKAGVQIPLLETLLAAGASVAGAPGGWDPLTAALANGRPETAAFLATRGARLDLEGAAGVGELDVVKSFFHQDGSLKAGANKAQMETGFMWACEYGHTKVVEYLLDQHLDVGTQVHGMTGLHWAAVGGQLDTIKLLLERKAPLEARNRYDGTVLGQATWAVMHSDPVYRWPQTETDWARIIQLLIEAGAKVEEADYPTGNERVDEVLRGRLTKSS